MKFGYFMQTLCHRLYLTSIRIRKTGIYFPSQLDSIIMGIDDSYGVNNCRDLYAKKIRIDAFSR